MPKVIKKTREETKSDGTAYCRKCMKTKQFKDFYEATNNNLDSNGYLSICKDCCNEIYDNHFNIYKNMETAVDFTCQELDIRFSKDAFKQMQSHVDKNKETGRNTNSIFGLYKSKLGSTTKTNESSYVGGRYKDSDKTFIEDVQKTVFDKFNLSESDFILTEEVVKYWGKNINEDDYEFLENEMYKLCSSFECPDYGMEMLMRDICFLNLNIEKVRQNTTNGDMAKLIDSRSKLMNDAKMKPIQASGAEANDQITFGTLIRKLENERPTETPLDEWKDPDNFNKWHKIFVGHLAAMNNISDTSVKEYKDSLLPYTVSRDDEGE